MFRGTHIALANAIQAEVVAQVAERSLVTVGQQELPQFQPCQGYTQQACPTPELDAPFACTVAAHACQYTACPSCYLNTFVQHLLQAEGAPLTRSGLLRINSVSWKPASHSWQPVPPSSRLCESRRVMRGLCRTPRAPKLQGLQVYVLWHQLSAAEPACRFQM